MAALQPVPQPLVNSTAFARVREPIRVRGVSDRTVTTQEFQMQAPLHFKTGIDYTPICTRYDTGSRVSELGQMAVLH